MASILSPFAHPFHPSYSIESFQVFNEGVPTLMPIGSDLIRGISDEAIDECYPPTAEEVAEMEAAEQFCAIMAHLEFMEEREEKARTDFTGCGKRWQARRELVGKPRPARSEKSALPPHAIGTIGTDPDDLVQTLVSYERRNQRVASDVNSLEVKHAHQKSNKNNEVKKAFRSIKPIQQPRKGY